MENMFGPSCLDGIELHHRIPESLSALFSMVSFTAANTSRMFEVSVACVKLENVSILGVERPREHMKTY